MFPDGTTALSKIGALAELAVKSGHKRFAAITQPGASSSLGALLGPTMIKVGAKFVGIQEISPGAPSYEAQCLSLQGAGANSVALAVVATQAIEFSENCASQGYHPTYTTLAEVFTQAMTKVPSLNGLLILNGNLPYYSKSSEAADFNAAVNQYESKFLHSGLYGGGSIDGWISGQLLVAALAKAHSKGAITSSEIVDGLYKLRNATLGGLVPPLTFIKGQPKTVACFFVGGISNGKLTTPFGPKAFCK